MNMMEALEVARARDERIEAFIASLNEKHIDALTRVMKSDITHSLRELRDIIVRLVAEKRQ